MKTRIILALFLISVLTPQLLADTLVLDNGRELEGVVVEETQTEVVFKLKTGSQITLPVSGIQNLVRSNTSELFLLEGDAFLEKEEFEKAHEAFQNVLRSGSDAAVDRLAKLDLALTDHVDKMMEGLNLEERENRLRGELEKTDSGGPYWKIYRTRLSRVLSEKGKRSLANRSPELARKNFSEAWMLDPENGDFGEEFLQALKGTKSSQDTVVQFLSEHIHRHPGHQALDEELASIVWKHNPCEAADLLAPSGIPIAPTHPELVKVFPNIFRKCFYANPFPDTARLSRTAYYEIYLELEPGADRAPLFEARLEYDPDDSSIYKDYGQYLVDSDRSEEAERVYRRLLEVEPNSQVANEFLETWEIEKERIAFQEQRARIKELERPYQLVAGLVKEDFPLIKDPTRLDDVIRAAAEVSAVLDNRPPALDGEPSAEAVEVLKGYRTELESESRLSKVRDLLVQTSKVRVRPNVGDKAPEFSLVDLQGMPLSLADFSGNVVLLYFWASWCPACRSEMILFNFLDQLVRDRTDFMIVGVTLDTEKSSLVEYLQNNPKIDWPQAFDGKGWETPAALVYGVDSLPSAYVIDSTGVIRAVNPRGENLINSILQVLHKPGEPTQSFELHGFPPVAP